VLLARKPDEEQLSTWRRGVVLEEGYKTQPCDVYFISSAGKGAWVRVIMGEGRKRQIRETGRLLGLPVVKIIRTRIGTLRLGSLKPRMWRYLTETEIAELKGEKKADVGQHSTPTKKSWTRKEGPRNVADKKPWSKEEAGKKPADRRPSSRRDDRRTPTDRKPWPKKDGDKKPFRKPVERRTGKK
jgi:23S rRNA pseudouridine2605 synthase